ncbi:MAG: hypothetical protein PHI18_08420 [bacterium]|nr:hypothetical protein [bacterium]
MKRKSHIVFFALAIVFATLAFREVVLVGFEYGHWAKLLMIGCGSAAAGLFLAAGIRAWRAQGKAGQTP